MGQSVPERGGVIEELLTAAMPQSPPTPDRERTRSQRQQQQISETALKPTAMRATMWPLLLPDAVCMAGSVAELLSASGAGFRTAQRVTNHMTTTRTISAARTSVTRERGMPLMRHHSRSRPLRSLFGDVPDEVPGSRCPVRRREAQQSRTPGRAPPASPPPSGRRTTARTATARPRPTN